MNTRPPIVYAHRGAATERPENTLPSFRRAIELGADALELDVHMTRDGHVVVAHDDTGKRMANDPRKISECTLAQVQSWNVTGQCRYYATSIPTFEEVLTTFPGVLLNVDLKQRRPCLVERFLQVVATHHAAEHVCVASFSGRRLAKVRRLGYTGTTALGRNEVVALYFAPHFLTTLRGPGRRAVQVPVRAGPLHFASPKFISKCHALGLRVDFWTINDPDQAEALLHAGADGIMTDDPAAIVPVVKKFRDA